MLSKLLGSDAYINLKYVMEINESIDKSAKKCYDSYICEIIGAKNLEDINFEKISAIEDNNVKKNILKYLADFEKTDFLNDDRPSIEFFRNLDENNINSDFFKLVTSVIFLLPKFHHYFSVYTKMIKEKYINDPEGFNQEFNTDCSIVMQMAYQNSFELVIKSLICCPLQDINKLSIRAYGNKPMAFVAAELGHANMLDLIFKKNKDVNLMNDDITIFKECLRGHDNKFNEITTIKSSILGTDYKKTFDLIVKHPDFEEILFISNPLTDSIKHRCDFAALALVNKFGLSPFIENMNTGVLQEFLDLRVSEIKKTEKIRLEESNEEKYVHDSMIEIDYKFLNTDLLSTNLLKNLCDYDEVDNNLTHPALSFFVKLKNDRFKVLYVLKTLYFIAMVLVPIYGAFVLYKEPDVKYLYLFAALCLTFSEAVEFGCLFIGNYNTKKYGIVKSIWRSICEYMVSRANIVDFLLLLSLFVSFVGLEIDDDDLYRRAFSVASFLASLDLTIFLTHIYPSLAIYLFMLQKVAKTFGKTMMFFIVILLTFAFNFSLIFYTSTKDSSDDMFHHFNDPLTTIIKIHVMLTGEYDAASLPYNGWYSQIMFLGFLFITILIFNFTNALAIDDVHVSIKLFLPLKLQYAIQHVLGIIPKA